MKQDKPRGVRVGRAPNRGKQKKFLTKAIWLGNNNLTNIDQIDKFVESVLEVPEALGWIDFSFNQIKDIDDVIVAKRRRPNEKPILFTGASEFSKFNHIVFPRKRNRRPVHRVQAGASQEIETADLSRKPDRRRARL